ncbi:hypothetical protein EL17_12785 [Anditalea andensis]|uniref:FAS1 domain-containing protein n=1 Tax=Anditalea andensis TaxID=1048983 RepID=A0A074KWC8_9BACT|nr:hypothetical protein EL17_12785 [Anditalea andensis]
MSIFTGCIDEDYTEEPQGLSDQPLLSNVIADQTDLSTFNQLINNAGLTTNLVGIRTQDQRAVFAPSNEAIANFLASNGYASAADIPNLTNVLSYHIANANILQGNIAQNNFNFIQTIANQNIFVNRANSPIRFNNQQVNIIRSIENANGTVHVIDQVLVPRASNMSNYIAAQADLSIFNQAINLMGLQNQFNIEFRTVFAPTNEAFGLFLVENGFANLDAVVADEDGRTLLRNILNYHMTPNVFYTPNLTNNLQLATQFTNPRLIITNPRVAVDGQSIRLTYGTGNALSTNVNVNNTIFRTGFVHKIDRVMVPATTPAP